MGKIDAKEKSGVEKRQQYKICSKAGVTNFFGTKSYFMGPEPHEGLPVC